MTVLRSQVEPKLAERAYRELLDALGEEKVTRNRTILFSYSGTALPIPKTMPDIVVSPRSVEDVQATLKIANRLVVPVTPIASGTLEPSVIPKAGGIVLDTYAMDNIREINADAAYAVIEPGVSVGKLSRAIAPHNFRTCLGSFPPGNSALLNYTLRGHGTHRSSGIDSEILGLEVVLPDGTLVETGSKAFSQKFPSATWHSPWGPLPDLRAIFLNACGTYGVVTGGAVRIYDRNEVQTAPLFAFDSYGDAVRFMVRASRANLVEHVATWHWGLVTTVNVLAAGEMEAADDFSLLFTTEPWQKLEDRPYNVAIPMYTGYAEDVETHRRLLEKVAAENGGRPFDDEARERFPGAWHYWNSYAVEHEPCIAFMRGFAVGFGFMQILYAEPEKVVDLEEWGLKHVYNGGLTFGTTYYSHCIDQGRTVFLRITPFVDPVDTEEHARAVEVYKSYIAEGMARYGAVPVRYDGINNYVDWAGGFGKLMKLIKQAVDPNNILNPGLRIYEEGW